MSSRPAPRVCLIEDDPIMGESLVDRLHLEGVRCDWHREGRSALAALDEETYCAVVSDVRLPDVDGETLYRALLARGAPPPTVFITGYGTVDQAVRLLQLGARDYVTKPFDLDDLLAKLRAACPHIAGAGSWLQNEPVLGISPAMRHVQDLLAQAARHGARLLLTGESGVGKEHAARYFHECADPRGVQPFQAVNCAAVHASLLEAELFGYEKGAFTGAVKSHRGLFERAHGGTLLLDEVGDMSLDMQAKLLRVLQDGRVERIGGDRPVDVRARVVCSTNRDLERMVEESAFRQDLYYRLNVVKVHLPPLRERREDITWFARMFLEQAQADGGPRRTLSTAAERHLAERPWPGNVRELRHAIERACIFARGPLVEPADLGDAPEAPPASQGARPAPPAEASLRDYLGEHEREYITQVLVQHEWRVTEAAEALGISRKNLWEKMRRHDIRR